MNRSKRAAFAIVLASVYLGAPAFAEGATGFGRDGQFILSAERMFGLTFSKTSNEDQAGNKTTDSRTDVTILWPRGTTVHEVPRIAFDAVIASGITVGGSIGFFSSTGSTKSEPANSNTSNENDDTSFTFWTITPRVGYVLPFAPQFAFWPRLGVNYFNLHTSNPGAGVNPATNKTTLNGFGMNIEPMFVYSPVPNFGIVGGPVIDIPFSGTLSFERDPPAPMPQPDQKQKFFDFGLTFGLLGYF